MRNKSYLSISLLIVLPILSALWLFIYSPSPIPGLIVLLWTGAAGLYFYHLNRRHRAELEAVLTLQRASVSALVDLAQMRDHGVTGSHMHRLTYYADVLCADLDLSPELRDIIARTISLHDIGKVGVPDRILNKPGPLTADEWAMIKQHPLAGAMVLDSITEDLTITNPEALDFLNIAKEIALYHHEKWDGSGYPMGLKGEEIPLSARIAALCDVYDSLRSPRPYKRPFTHEEAVAIVKSGKGTHFDPELVQRFLRLADHFAAIWNEHGELVGNS